MARHPYPNEDKPSTTEEGGSVRITIPSGVRDALGLEAGEEPETVEFDPDNREFAMQFRSDS